jgi:putative transcriptional regulator
MADEAFGRGLLEGLSEVAAWKRGETALEIVNIEPMPAQRIKAIRAKVARSPAKFEAKYGIPAATVSGWEQGRRKPDPAARLLLKAIEADPDFIERVARSAYVPAPPE